MKKLLIFAVSMLLATQTFASYIVVLRDGTRYKAKTKWTVVNGKALVNLESGQTLAIDPNLIDVAKSDQLSKLGLGDVNVITLDASPNSGQKQEQSSLGSQIKLRKPPVAQPDTQTPKSSSQSSSIPPAVIPTGTNILGQDIVEKFGRSYENVGLFEQKLTATGPHSLRAELTADSEEKVFNAISATSFLMVRNAGVPGVVVDQVELFMKTTTGGSSGRFQMTREDALALDSKKISIPDYFVKKVIY